MNRHANAMNSTPRQTFYAHINNTSHGQLCPRAGTHASILARCQAQHPLCQSAWWPSKAHPCSTTKPYHPLNEHLQKNPARVIVNGSCHDTVSLWALCVGPMYRPLDGKHRRWPAAPDCTLPILNPRGGMNHTQQKCSILPA